MSKSVLFAVHGMGVHGTGWEKEIGDKLEEVAGRYSAFEAHPASLWDRVELIGVRYDNIFADQIKSWQADAGGVMGYLQKSKLAAGTDLSWIEGFVKNDPNFFWTHVADVLLYRFFDLHRAAVQSTVARQIVDKIQTIPNKAFDDCTVLAHSLGTAVAHDTLHRFGTSKFDGISMPFDPANARFRSICMLANTSRVLEREVDAYLSLVRGGPRSSFDDDVELPKSDCSQFFSWHHQWDPFCLLKRYAPDHWETRGWPPRFNTIGELTHFRDWDVHALGHYLDNPRVHIPLLNVICGEDVVPSAERLDKLKKYEKYGGRLREVPKIADALKAIGGELTALHENVDLATMFTVWSRVHALAKELKAEVDALRQDLKQDIA